MAGHSFLGTWEVSNCGFYAKERSIDRILFQFNLDENGGVTWYYPDELSNVTLFNCDTYEIYTTANMEVYIRFALVAGQVLEFRSDQLEPKEKVVLTCKGLCILKCRKIPEGEYRPTNKFTFLTALEEGFFSDLKIVASNKKEFHAHSTILRLHCKDINWLSDPPPFDNLPEDVLRIILHFIYSEALPENITEDLAAQVITQVATYDSLARLNEMCQIYLDNMQFKDKILQLITDMHTSLNQIIDYFKPKSSSETIANNPSQFCYAIKQSIRDVAVVGINLLLICDLFQKTKGKLPKSERVDIIKYAKARLPHFFVQLTKLVDVLKTTFLSMTPAQQADIAIYLAPQIGLILDKLSELISQLELALQQVIINHIKLSLVRGRRCRNILDIDEISKLRTFQEHVYCSSVLLDRKRNSFFDMSAEEKLGSIGRDLELLIDELPICLMRLDEDKAAFDEKLNWKEFYFCFVVGTSKITSILQKIVTQSDSFQMVLHQFCDVVKRDAFNQALKDMQLFDDNFDLTKSMQLSYRELQMLREEYEDISEMLKGMRLLDGRYLCSQKFADYDFTDPIRNQKLYGHEVLEFDYKQNLYTAPPSKDGNLTKLTEKSLDGANSDMEFVLTYNDDEIIFKAHRVIVASRCDWFRRALTSGMKEDIDKRIFVHDSNPTIFKMFLKYLYMDKINFSSLNSDQRIDVLVLADRYEVDSLKQTTEYILQSSIELDVVLSMTRLADQFNAKILKSACFYKILQHPSLVEVDEFLELPLSLQVEVFDCILNPCGKPKYIEIADDDDATPEPHLHCEKTKLELCLKQIRDIVGDVTPREGLVRIILAADYDLCRAVNYFYARN
ncbi:unnamed protein product [Brassicogethes aeneus]|uniref:BTB domain-containing protein n=1 Tax=Brassicogethes aeneus TaxID=1431903 RepID=A0A9P0FIV3_BRAAE|nr:unnamed protein product [Brassicogethes aeneus]